MNINDIEEILISTIFKIQKISGEKEVNVDRNSCPFNLPNFDSLRFFEVLVSLKFSDFSFEKVKRNLTYESTIKDIAEEIQIQLIKK